MPLTAQQLVAYLHKHQTDISALNAIVQLIGDIQNSTLSLPAIEINKGTERVTDLQATFPAVACKSIAFANVGTANAIVEGKLLKPGEITEYNAGGNNNYYAVGAFSYDCTINPGAELLIIYNY